MEQGRFAVFVLLVHAHAEVDQLFGHVRVAARKRDAQRAFRRLAEADDGLHGFRRAFLLQKKFHDFRRAVFGGGEKDVLAVFGMLCRDIGVVAEQHFHHADVVQRGRLHQRRQAGNKPRRVRIRAFLQQRFRASGRIVDDGDVKRPFLHEVADRQIGPRLHQRGNDFGHVGAHGYVQRRVLHGACGLADDFCDFLRRHDLQNAQKLFLLSGVDQPVQNGHSENS